MTKSVLSAFKGNIQKKPPLWLMRQAGRYLSEYKQIRSTVPSFMDLCFSPSLASKITQQPIQRFGFDAAILFSDILVIPHRLGQTVHFEQGEGPKLIPVDWTDFLKKASIEKMLEHLNPVYETLKDLQTTLPPSCTLIGFAGAPWTIATYMVEGGKSTNFSTIRLWAENQDQRLQRLLDLLAEAVGRFLVRQIRSGAEVVQIFDSWAAQVPLSNQEDCTVRPLKKILQHVSENAPDVPVIYYGRGISALYPSLADQFPNLVFGVGHEANRKWLHQSLPKKTPVQGNLDPETLVQGGKSLDREIQSILDDFSQRPFVFNLGHGILPQTPIAHVERLIQQVRGS